MHISGQFSKYSGPLLPLLVFNIQNISQPKMYFIPTQNKDIVLKAALQIYLSSHILLRV